jgi:hypothetical protein
MSRFIVDFLLTLGLFLLPNINPNPLCFPRSIKVLSEIEQVSFATSFEAIRFSLPDLGIAVNPESFTNSDGKIDISEIDAEAIHSTEVLLADFTRFGNKDLESFKGSKCLRFLDVSGSKIDDNCILTLTSFHHLEALDVSDTKLSGVSIRKLTLLPRLRWLSISGVEVSEEDLDHLLKGSSIEFLFCNRLKGEERRFVIQSDTLRTIDLSFSDNHHFTFGSLPNLKMLFLTGLAEKNFTNQSGIPLNKLLHCQGNLKGIGTGVAQAEYMSLGNEAVPKEFLSTRY